MATWKQKANTITDPSIQCNESVGGSPLIEKPHLRSTHGIVGMCLRRHVGLMMLLLWHIVEANKSCIMSLGINCGSKAISCWPSAARPTEVGVIVIVIVMGDAQEHTTITGGVVVVVATLDIMRNTLHRKIHYYNFPMAGDRNTSNEEP